MYLLHYFIIYTFLRHTNYTFPQINSSDYKLPAAKIVSGLVQMWPRTDRIKVLFWEGDGFLLLYKRLKMGTFQWSRTENELKELMDQRKRFFFLTH